MEDEAPLLVATRDENVDQVARLLRAQADPNVRDFLGETALFEAAACECKPLIELLLAARADPALKSKAGKQARDMTESAHVRLLITSYCNGAGRNAKKMTQEVRDMKSCGYRPSLNLIEDEEPPLILAVRKGDFSLAQKLIQIQADPNCVGFLSEPPLFEAAASGSVKLTSMLLFARADPSFRNPNGNAAIELASERPIRALLRVAIIDAEGGSDVSTPLTPLALEQLEQDLKVLAADDAESAWRYRRRFKALAADDTESRWRYRTRFEVASEPCSESQVEPPIDARRTNSFWAEARSLGGTQEPEKDPPAPAPATAPIVDVELLAKKAVGNMEVKIRCRSNSTFMEVKRMLAEQLGRLDLLPKIWFVRRSSSGVYHSYTDSDQIGDLRTLMFLAPSLQAS